ncbi:hypothetical protein [Pantoea allii]|uniref:hypothetical protein n=1 Tax=Pantoea allii TaxID=574096 RepID=UPI0024B85147|nr:hypothetical protein [Pantoea allii]MDJ0087661.1 hypothetical protein [Pantoea allii]
MISERMKQRIEEMPNAQLIDWICLYCVDVRSTHSDDDAQEFINDIREVLEMRLNATAQPVSDKPSLKAMMNALDAFYADESVPESAMMKAFRILLADVMPAAAPGGQ